MGPTVGIVLEQLSVITNEPPTLVHRQSWCSPSMAQIAPTLLLRDQRFISPISNVYTSISFLATPFLLIKNLMTHYQHQVYSANLH